MNMGTMALATVGEEGTKIHTDTRAFASCILAFFFFFGYYYANWTSVSLDSHHLLLQNTNINLSLLESLSDISYLIDN